jgi:hypothetical protein
MARLSTVLLLALTMALAVGAQSPQKRWASADEYNLATRIFADADPDHQIVLLREWVARYPKTDFERERLISFALAFQRAGKLSESFTCATELLNLDPNDPGALLLVVTLGPTLPSVSDHQIAMVTASAIKLLSINLVPSPLPANASSPEPTASSSSFIDPETQRVLAFVRQLRKAREVRVHPEDVKRQVAEAALEWAKNLKR